MSLIAAALAAKVLACPPGGIRTYVHVPEPSLHGTKTEFVRATWETLRAADGWRRSGAYFCPAKAGDADIEIVLASPSLADQRCYPIATYGEVSCAIGPRATINVERWRSATSAWSDLRAYQHYVINHEVGHVLGLGHARACLADGRAPLMLQQSRRRPRCETPGAWPTAYEIHVLKQRI